MDPIYILEWAVVVLLPLVPTVVVYKWIRDRQTRAAAKGSLFGIEWDASGAIAAYVVCFLLGMFALSFLKQKSSTQVDFLIQASGEGKDLRQFISSAETQVEMELSFAGLPPVRVPHFDVNQNRNLLTGKAFIDSAYSNKPFTAKLLDAGKSVAIETDAKVLSSTLYFTVDFGSKARQHDWTAHLDSYLFYTTNGAQDLYQKELIVIDHDLDASLSTIPLHSYLGPGAIVSFEVGARRMDKRDVQTLVKSWGASLRGKSPDDYRTTFEARFQEAKLLGTEIAVRHFTNSDFKLEGQGERFQRGRVDLDGDRMIPTIGPVVGGISSDQAVVVYVESWRRTDSEFRFSKDRASGGDVWLGDTFERHTDEAWFGIVGDDVAVIDRATVRTEYHSNTEPQWTSPDVAELLKGANAIVLRIEELRPSQVAKILWAWKPPKARRASSRDLAAIAGRESGTPDQRSARSTTSSGALMK